MTEPIGLAAQRWTAERVAEVRKLRAAGMSLKEAAAAYGVTKSVLSKALRYWAIRDSAVPPQGGAP